MDCLFKFQIVDFPQGKKNQLLVDFWSIFADPKSTSTNLIRLISLLESWYPQKMISLWNIPFMCYKIYNINRVLVVIMLTDNW